MEQAGVQTTPRPGVIDALESVPRIVAVKPLGSTRLLVRFGNDEQRVYDCQQLFTLPRFHMLTCPAFFRAVQVDAGGYGVSWSDDIDLSEYELWTNGEPIADHPVQAGAPAAARRASPLPP